MARKISGYTLQQLRVLDPDLLLAIIREKAHVTLEYPLYQNIYANKKLPPKLGETLRVLLSIWEKRGLPHDRADLKWCYELLELSDQVRDGKKPELLGDPVEFSEDKQEAVTRLIRTRRSVRVWQDTPVARELVEEVLTAGLWAPHSCNLQSIRYIVLEGEAAKQLNQTSQLMGSLLCVIVAQDLRAYECFEAIVPTHNRYLECGAAVQNMLLCAHALGLGAVWLTFEKGEAEAMHQHLSLPKHVMLSTYIALGWPAQRSIPPGRITVEDATLFWE